jgi:hypothetical protein
VLILRSSSARDSRRLLGSCDSAERCARCLAIAAAISAKLPCRHTHPSAPESAVNALSPGRGTGQSLESTVNALSHLCARGAPQPPPHFPPA